MKSRRPSHRATCRHAACRGRIYKISPTRQNVNCWFWARSEVARKSRLAHYSALVRADANQTANNGHGGSAIFPRPILGPIWTVCFFAAAGRLRKQKVLVNKLQFVCVWVQFALILSNFGALRAMSERFLQSRNKTHTHTRGAFPHGFVACREYI